MLFIKFVYGLAFFYLGTAVALKTTAGARTRLGNTLWALSWFGLIHASSEWADMLASLGESYWSPRASFVLLAAKPILSAASFLLLERFGFGLLADLFPGRPLLKAAPTLATLTLAAALAVFWKMNPGAINPPVAFNPYIRLFAGIPATLAAGGAFLVLAKRRRNEPAGDAQVARDFIGLSAAFLFYGLFAGLITEKGAHFPASVLNGPNFQSLTGVPIQLLRAACAGLSALFMTRVLDCFEAQAREAVVRDKERAEQQSLELRKAQQQLVQSAKLASLGELSAGIAHEINQPLFLIQGFSNRIRSEFAKSESVRRERVADALQEIGEGVDRIIKIITHVREFSRQAEIRLEPVAINPIIEKSFYLLSEQLKLKRIEVATDLAPENPYVRGNKIRLEQAFVNLIVNARDAIESSPRNGSGRIQVRSRVEGRRVILEFSDNGTGIDSAVAQRIFDPFFTTKEVGKGTGLGLSITLGIIQEHHGEIACHSQPGEGATFRIALPASEAPTSGA